MAQKSGIIFTTLGQPRIIKLMAINHVFEDSNATRWLQRFVHDTQNVAGMLLLLIGHLSKILSIIKDTKLGPSSGDTTLFSLHLKESKAPAWFFRISRPVALSLLMTSTTRTAPDPLSSTAANLKVETRTPEAGMGLRTSVYCSP